VAGIELGAHTAQKQSGACSPFRQTSDAGNNEFRESVGMVNQENLALASHLGGVDDKLIDRLLAVPWDFAAKRKASVMDSLHPYPAKFIPEIPAALLDSLSLDAGAVIFDPFCGSGTTLAEAQRRGFDSIGVDLNPIACLISRVRTVPLPPNAVDSASAVIERAKSLIEVPIPAIPNLDHWFTSIAQDAIARLVAAIDVAPAASSDFLKLALSSVLVRVSNQDSDTRYAAVEKNISQSSVYTAFEGAVARIANALRMHVPVRTARIIEHDALALSPNQFPKKIKAVITSPPYPNAYEYWLYHKYRMWWLGHDPLAIKEREIGARAHFFGGKRHDATSFVFQMKHMFNLLDKILDTDAYACFVVGRSKIHGEIVDNAAIIKEAGKAIGMREVLSIERCISASRKSFNLSHANIKTETVLVLAR
jgi:site-specific DNA-methyltransferase (cytosine-N4-specific)